MNFDMIEQRGGWFLIHIGLTGWGDHPTLIAPQSKAKLTDYSSYFPVVEVDSTFYAIPAQATIEKWIKETPRHFKMIVKAYGGMTGHTPRNKWPAQTMDEVFHLFELTMQPLIQAGQLAMVLFQFPPQFTCTREHIRYLKYVKQKLPDFPITVEFRHHSWYQLPMLQQMRAFMTEQNWVLATVDEPQVGEGSVPLDFYETHAELAFIRLHGRHESGWINRFASNEEWRKQRYLYDYAEDELQQLQQQVQQLRAKDIFVIFNNNSGHHASKNAIQFQRLMDIQYEHLASKQLDLFEGE